MTKVAIQLYGHLRSYTETYKAFQNNLIKVLNSEGYDVDVFIHTWSETDTSDASWHNLNGDARGKNTSDTDKDNIEKFYSPKKFLMENQIIVKNNFELKEILMSMPRQYRAIINSSYTKFRVNELRKEYEKENNITYDYIIQTRPDVIFNKPFGIKMFLKGYYDYKLLPKNNEIYCTSIPFRRSNIEPDIFLCSIDLIFFAKPDVLNTVNNLYQDIVSQNIDLEWIKENLYSLEILWLMYLKLKNIELVKLKYFQFTEYDLIRDVKNYSNMPTIMDASMIKQQAVKKNGYYKSLISLLKFFPYCLVHKKIKKLNDKLNRKF